MLQTHHQSRPLSLIYDIIPFALVAVQGCPYHDKLLFCHSSPITLYPAPRLLLAATHSIAWSVCIPVLYINPNTSPKELQLSSLGYFPSLRDAPLVLRGLRNQISSSTHSGVVRGHVELRSLGSASSDDKKSVRLKSH